MLATSSLTAVTRIPSSDTARNLSDAGRAAYRQASEAYKEIVHGGTPFGPPRLAAETAAAWESFVAENPGFTPRITNGGWDFKELRAIEVRTDTDQFLTTRAVGLWPAYRCEMLRDFALPVAWFLKPDQSEQAMVFARWDPPRVNKRTEKVYAALDAEFRKKFGRSIGPLWPRYRELKRVVKATAGTKVTSEEIILGTLSSWKVGSRCAPAVLFR